MNDTENSKKPFAYRLSRLLLLLLALAFAGSRLGVLHWFGDYLALLHDWYLLLSVVLGGLLAWQRRWSLVGLALVLMLANGAFVLPYFLGGDEGATAETTPITLLVYNIYTSNSDLPAVVDEVRRHDPDVFFLMEYSYDIQAQIEAEFADYPFQLIEPSRFTMGLALFSRLPLENTTVHRQQATRIPVFEADIMVNGEAINFVGGHPWPPLPQWGTLHREQMADITDVAAAADHPLIVVGDFNASQWSSTVNNLSQRADVSDAHLGRGLLKTWHGLPLLSLTLDHILVSDDVQVHSYTRGERGDSDHSPLIVEISR